MLPNRRNGVAGLRPFFPRHKGEQYDTQRESAAQQTRHRKEFRRPASPADAGSDPRHPRERRTCRDARTAQETLAVSERKSRLKGASYPLSIYGVGYATDHRLLQAIMRPMWTRWKKHVGVKCPNLPDERQVCIHQ